MQTQMQKHIVRYCGYGCVVVLVVWLMTIFTPFMLRSQEMSSQSLPAQGFMPDFVTNFSSVAKNSVYVEIGGSAAIYSLNYDRLITPNWLVRIGVSYLGFGTNTLQDGVATTLRANVLLVPLTSSVLINFPQSPHHIEIGGGATLLFGSAFSDVSNQGYNSLEGAFAGATLIAAYRLQPVDAGFFFRAAFTPIGLFTPIAVAPLPWAGISFGGTF